MAIKIFCENGSCKKELDEQGALLFSPPAKDQGKRTRKVHLCRDCYHWIALILKLELIPNPDLSREPEPLSNCKIEEGSNKCKNPKHKTTCCHNDNVNTLPVTFC